RGVRAAPGSRQDAARKCLGAALPAIRRRKGQGLGAVVGVAEGAGGSWDLAWAVQNHTETAPAKGMAVGGRGAGGSFGRLAGGRQGGRLAEVLAAIGSPHRVKILVKLLEGPATYRAIQKTTRLKAGPLYHHVAQLRLAGLIGPKQRDLYELTRGGRNLVLVALTLPSLVRDRRRRPQPDSDTRPTGGRGKRG
ncbi:MAG: hypothetical protein ACYS7M_08795, partial [Planctomycetota bacterium]